MIEVRNLSKSYGRKRVLSGISFSVGKHEIVGFLGPNGAGKSTTINIITGYISSGGGEISVCGYDILENSAEAKRSIGYLPEIPPLYPDMRVEEYLNFAYDLKGCRLNRKKHIDEVISIAKIADIRRQIIGTLSKGYRQRVGIAQALVGNPPVIILDEPTIGLDPRQTVEMRNLIRMLGRDHSILFSTHILSEVSATCDRVVMIDRGRVVADKRIDEITQTVSGPRRIQIEICAPKKDALSFLRGFEGVSAVEALPERESDSASFSVESADGIDIRRPLFRALASKGWPIIALQPTGMKLEDVFIELTDTNTSNPTGRENKRI